ncbi:LysR family transcriptional regulator [Vibrio diabolicus]|uniref:LysR family transcriptional regulator n=1 Tax=Vibrio diabolicus TaxID=50719 RepID=UPI000CE965BC|nr:LysR family transcriptional regulator [Vibrio diabolicus]AVF59238.1 LysR family transcriptional regulator [Vibrio diabolicus]
MFNNLNRIHTFIAVIESGSFTKAAERLFISKAMVSIHVKSLEDSLKVPLLIRNSRGFVMTEAGELLYNDFKDIFSNIQTTLEKVTDKHYSLSGNLKISSTVEFGETFLIPIIADFCHSHPEMNISFYADSSLNELVSEQIDLAVRLGTLNDSSLKSRKLVNYNIIMVASSDWFKNNPLSSIEHLNSADWIANSNLQTPTQWTLRNKSNHEFKLKATAKFNSNSSTSIKSMVKSGLGIAILPEWVIRKELENGDFVQLFPEWSLPKQDVSVVFAGDHRIRLKCRSFIDHLAQNISLKMTY